MSLFTEYLASISAQTAQAEAAQKAAKAEAEQKAKEAISALMSQRADAEDQLLQDAGLSTDYQELLEVEAAVNQQYNTAKAEVQTFAFMAEEAAYAASLVEQKAQAIETLVTKMESEGLLADQVNATKQGHLDVALSSHNAAKAAKERVARLLANKKIK